MRRPRPHLLAVLLCLAVALPPTGAANAAETTSTDPARDMREDGLEPAPRHTIGDVRSVRVNHTERAVRLRVSFTELRRQGRCIELSGVIRTDDDPPWGPEGFVVGAGPACEDPVGPAWVCAGEMDTFQGPAFWCEMDFARDVVRVRVPRFALEEPRWVRAKVQTLHVTAADRYFRDRLDGGWTPRVRAG